MGERSDQRGSDLDPAGGDEGLHIGRVQPHMPADLHVGDPSLRDQAAYESHRRASRSAASSTVNSLSNTRSYSCYAALMVMVRSSSLAMRRSSRARAAAEAASHASPVVW